MHAPIAAESRRFRRGGYADPVTTMPFRPLVLRKGIVIDDPLGVILGLLKAHRLDVSASSWPTPFGEPDLRLANRGGTRVLAADLLAPLASLIHMRGPASAGSDGGADAAIDGDHGAGDVGARS